MITTVEPLKDKIPPMEKVELETKDPAAGSARDSENVGSLERWLSVLGGGALALYGLRKANLPGFGLAALGGALIERGVTGHCAAYQALDISTKEHGQFAAVGAGRGVKHTCAITIQRPARELYDFWRNLENLPDVMSHLVSVEENGDCSHWVAHAPVGLTVAWDAEIVNDEPHRLIAWRSLAGSQVSTAGSVHFNQLGHDRGTEVLITLKYDPPGGKLGSWLAWLFGEEPAQQIREDLQQWKQRMESGQFAATQ